MIFFRLMLLLFAPGDECDGCPLEEELPGTNLNIELWMIILLIFTFVWLWKYQQSKARSID